jgi:hypothetical protein
MIKNKGKICLVEKCGEPAFCKGYCTKHYQQIHLNGKLKKEQTYMCIPGLCKNIGCGGKVFAKGLCQKCYRRERKRK